MQSAQSPGPKSGRLKNNTKKNYSAETVRVEPPSGKDCCTNNGSATEKALSIRP